jgi:tetratricopeptide (TPR) repeat protein
MARDGAGRRIRAHGNPARAKQFLTRIRLRAANHGRAAPAVDLFAGASKHPSVNPGKRASLLAVVVIVVAALGAYANTMEAPLAFDDLSSIEENPSIRQLWPPWAALSPPGGWGFTVSGRPILNYSLAINYAISGERVWSYHGFNLGVHILAALTLFGLVRRTFQRPVLAAQFGEKAWPLALAIAVLWALHPLQTEAVTYIIQRAESLMGLFFLLTLYGFVRSLDSARPGLWWGVSIGACLLGVGTKEIAALAPVLVFLYDRTFVSGSFRAAWQRHRWQHVTLAATWVPLLGFLLSTGGDRGGTFHFADKAMWVGHALTQFEAVTRYFWLTVWPHPQVFDYGEIPPPSLGRALLWALPVLGLAGATLVALWRWPVAGFLGAWVFLILAPTSALPATLQIIVEHRMYLPLAAIITFVAAGAYLVAGSALLPVFFALAAGAGWLTVCRNEIYRSDLGLWSDTIAKRPGNARAYDTLGSLWLRHGNPSEAQRCFAEAVRLRPDYALAYYNLGIALQRSARDADAIAPFLTAIRLEPDFVNAHVNLGVSFLKLGRAADAAENFSAAIRSQPDSADLHYNLALALSQLGRPSDAIREYQSAVRLQPNFSAAHFGLGELLRQMNRLPEAIGEFRKTLQSEPGDLQARLILGNLLLVTRRVDEAVEQYELILRAHPDDPDVLRNLEQARALMSSSSRKP